MFNAPFAFSFVPGLSQAVENLVSLISFLTETSLLAFGQRGYKHNV